MESRKDIKTDIDELENEGFFKRIFGGLSNPKKRILRALKKELSSAKIDLYKLKQDTVSVPIARMIFEIYKITYPIRQFFNLDEKSKRFSPSFEESFVLQFHDEKSLEMYKMLSSEEEITKKISEIGIKKATSYFEKLLNEYIDFFSKEKIFEINKTFSNLLYFARFVHYDFYLLLREFDPNLEEAQFLKKPSFTPAEGPLIREEIYNLQQALLNFDEGKLLDTGIEIASKIIGFSPIDKKHYERLKGMISTIKNNGYLILILKAIDKTLTPPKFQKAPVIDIFSAFTFRLKGFIFSTLNRIKKKIRENAIKNIISKIFEGDVVGRIKNYSELKNNHLESLNLPTFTYVEPLNYLKAFLTDKYKPEISKLVNELIVGGIFLNKGFLNKLSNSYYALDNLLQKIEDIDDDLDVDGKSGKTINRLISSINRDSNAKFLLEKTINDINKRAKVVIDEGIVNIKDLAQCIKEIIEDYKKKKPTLVSNIKKIRPTNNPQFIKELVSAYTTLFYFLKLLGLFVSLKVTRADVEKMKKTILIDEK